MMIGEQYAEMVEDEQILVEKAKTLALGDWNEHRLYLVHWSRGDFAISTFRAKVDPKLADGLWKDHFAGFITGAAHVKKALAFLQIDEMVAADFYERVEGGSYLLYADEGQLERYYRQYSEFIHASSTVPEEYREKEIDPTPGASHTDIPQFPKHGDQRVNMDGQNIRREGDLVYDPRAERGYPPKYYTLGQRGLGERDHLKDQQ